MLCVQDVHSGVRRCAEVEVVSSFQEVVGCDDDLGWDVSVGKVELKQDWFGLVWVGLGWAGLDRTDWIVKGGRSQAGRQAGRGRAGQMGMEREKVEQSTSLCCSRCWTG